MPEILEDIFNFCFDIYEEIIKKHVVKCPLLVQPVS